METPIRVVIADDNADMRRIERMMISRAEGFEIVGEAEDGVQLAHPCGAGKAPARFP